MFERGRIYHRRADLHARYGGQRQGGISTPAGQPLIFLFTGRSGERYGYTDGWDSNGVFLYAGEGQRGDMQFTNGNLAIRDHAYNGKELHLFESLGKGRGCRYMGNFTCSSWEYRSSLDVDGNSRSAIVFHLVPVDDAIPSADSESAANQHSSIDDLRTAALTAATQATQGSQSEAKRITYERSLAVKGYVLARAQGICESCRNEAPFVRKGGRPYLEPHHTRRLSDGGPDHPRWVGAVCPNCHSEIHYGEHGDMKNAALIDYLGKLETSS